MIKIFTIIGWVSISTLGIIAISLLSKVGWEPFPISLVSFIFGGVMALFGMSLYFDFDD